jgi:hypothetical protein
MKPFLLLFGLLFVVPATGQEHEPMAAQCQADAAVWGDSGVITEYLNARTAFMERGAADRTEVTKLGWKQINMRMSEMGRCAEIEPQRVQQYVDAADFYERVIGDRLGDFVMRHNLWSQFKKEDDQGKR